MFSKNRSASLVAAVVGAFILSLTQPPVVAQAAVKATSNNVLTVVSGSVKVFATATQTFTSTGVALSIAITNGTAKTFFVNNGGSLSVSRFIMTITLPNSSNVSAFRRCPVNVSFTGSNTCASGSPVVLTNPVSGSATTYVLTLPGNGYYSFQIVQNKTGTLGVSTSATLTNVTGSVTNS